MSLAGTPEQTWGETCALLEAASSDTSTPLGAKLAGWAYPASLAQILLLSATIGDPDVARKAMPWEMADAQRRAEESKPSQLEIDQATAELDDEIIFTNE